MNNNDLGLDKNDVGQFDKVSEETMVLKRVNDANTSHQVSESDEFRILRRQNDAEEIRVSETKEDMNVDLDGTGGGDLKGGGENIERISECSDEKSGLESKESGGSKDGKRSELGPSRVRKGQVEVVKFSVVSRYEEVLDEFDEYAASARGGVVESPPGHGYEIGDMVWGKVKSHPWWPGHIYSEVFASPSVRRTKSEGQVLVAFFGDSSYGWFDPAELVPFDSSFSEKSKQTSSRTFVKAVEEAVDEATRRSALGLACRCRNPYNFRPEKIQGYFAVDVCDYEPGSVYSADQIKKARDNLRPREMVAFVNQLAASPTGNEHGDIEFMKNKAAVIAYRKAVYEEFDETYAQAFGHQPEVRPSHRNTLDTGQSLKVPTRAPLSGPLVIAEALGKAKGFSKVNKSKVQAKKDQYLFKRRDEANELKSGVQINPSSVTSLPQPVYRKDSSAIAKDDYVLQERSPSVSTEHAVQEKQPTEMRAGNYVSDTSREVPADESGMTMENKFAAVRFGATGTQMDLNNAESPSISLVDQDPGRFSHPLEGKHEGMRKEASLEVSHSAENSSKMTVEMPSTFESSRVNIDFKDVHPSSTASECFDPPLSQPAKSEPRDSFTAAHLSEKTDAKFHGKDTKVRSDIGVGEKKLKVRKRIVGELNSASSVALEKTKKKPKKDVHISGGKDGSSVDNVAGKYVPIPVASRDSQVDPRKKDNVSTSFSAPVATKILKTENMKLELPQLLYNLKAVARNPFHHVESSPAVVQQIVLKFRSLVFQKSLAPLTLANSESKETRPSKVAGSAATNNVSSENVRELQSVQRQKLVVRPDDPAKGGQKRGLSDRLEEISAKRKKIIDAKTSTTQKTDKKSSLMQRGEAKEISASTMKSVKREPVKKVEPPSRASDPTMLVMKFPLQNTLPSINELKARFIRFGQLDHSACRVFWKSSTCRVVFRHKVDAQAAYKFASGASNMFGSTGVRCYLREMEVAAPEQELGKVQRDEGSMSASQLRETAVERRVAVPLTPQTMQQSGTQLKSILKRATGDEIGGNGGIRGTPRVKFMLGGEENSRGEEQLIIGNTNNINASFVDGGTSSTSHDMDINRNIFQNINPPPSSLPPLLPIPTTTGTFQYPRAPQDNLQYTEVAPRTAYNLNISTEHQMASTAPYIDISQQMISLLTKCNDIVSNVSAVLGYVPYHPL